MDIEKIRALKSQQIRKKHESDQTRERRNKLRHETLSKKRSDSQLELGDSPSDTQLSGSSNQNQFYNFFRYLSGPEKSQLCHQNFSYVHPFTAFARVFC
jgi:hypothetical protein